MDGVEEDEYTSDPIAQQTRQVGVFRWLTLSLFELINLAVYRYDFNYRKINDLNDAPSQTNAFCLLNVLSMMSNLY